MKVLRQLINFPREQGGFTGIGIGISVCHAICCMTRTFRKLDATRRQNYSTEFCANYTAQLILSYNTEIDEGKVLGSCFILSFRQHIVVVNYD